MASVSVILIIDFWFVQLDVPQICFSFPQFFLHQLTSFDFSSSTLLFVILKKYQSVYSPPSLTSPFTLFLTDPLMMFSVFFHDSLKISQDIFTGGKSRRSPNTPVNSTPKNDASRFFFYNMYFSTPLSSVFIKNAPRLVVPIVGDTSSTAAAASAAASICHRQCCWWNNSIKFAAYLCLDPVAGSE